MALSDLTDCTGILNSSQVKKVATAALAPPGGGGSFLSAWNTIVVASGSSASFFNGSGFAPCTKGGIISAALQRGTSGGTTGWANYVFLGLQGTAITNNAYLFGLSDSSPSHLVLRKGALSGGLPDVAPGLQGVIWRSTATYPIGAWVHLQLMGAYNLNTDMVLSVNVSTTGDVTAPTWVALPGIAIAGSVTPAGNNGLIDDGAGIITGTPSYAGGRFGIGAQFTDVNRVAIFDAISIVAQT